MHVQRSRSFVCLPTHRAPRAATPPHRGLHARAFLGSRSILRPFARTGSPAFCTHISTHFCDCRRAHAHDAIHCYYLRCRTSRTVHAFVLARVITWLRVRSSACAIPRFYAPHTRCRANTHVTRDVRSPAAVPTLLHHAGLTYAHVLDDRTRRRLLGCGCVTCAHTPHGLLHLRFVACVAFYV